MVVATARVWTGRVNRRMQSDENILIERAKAGELAAFDSLVEMHAKRIYRLAYRHCWDRDDADDLTQQTFVRAFRHLRTFRQGEDFGAWLNRIVVNLCISHGRRQQRAEPPASVAADETDANPTAAERAESIAVSCQVQEAIRHLPKRQRAAIVLFELEGLSVAETASVMGCSAGTVKRHLHRARKTLRKQLLELVEHPVETLGGVEDELQEGSPHVERAGRQTTAE